MAKINFRFRRSLLILTLIVAFFGARWWYFRPSVHQGTVAPPIIGDSADGRIFSLDQFKDEYVYLNFWGSWCGPCLAKIPEINQLRGDLPPDQLRIVHVAVEDDSLRWRSTLNRLQIPGDAHLIDLSTSLRFFNGPIVSDYGIKEVPSAFLLAPGNKIVAHNPSMDKIRRITTER